MHWLSICFYIIPSLQYVSKGALKKYGVFYISEVGGNGSNVQMKDTCLDFLFKSKVKPWVKVAPVYWDHREFSHLHCAKRRIDIAYVQVE